MGDCSDPLIVLIVLDPDFGGKLNAEVTAGPVWLCHSPANRAAAEKLRAQKSLPRDHVTVFTPTDAASREAMLLGILDDVDQHHYGWSQLQVRGCKPTAAVKSALANSGVGGFEETADGFVFDRRNETHS